MKDNLEGSSCEPVGSVCLSSCSTAFPHTTPASLAAFLFPESLVIVLRTPGLACCSLLQLLLLHLPHLSRQAVSWASLKSHSAHIPLHPHSFTPLQSTQAGTLEKEESGHHPELTEDSMAKRAGPPSPTACHPARSQALGEAGSNTEELTPGSR